MKLITKHIFSLFFILTIASQGYSQSLILDNDPEKFVGDFQKQMEKNLGAGAKTKLLEFADIYKNLNSESKKNVVVLIQNLTKRGVKPIELFTVIDVIKGATTSNQVSSAEMPSFLEMLVKAFDNQISKKINEVLASLDNILNKNMVYNSNFNKLYYTSTKLKFKYFDTKQDYFNQSVAVVAANNKVDEEDIGWGEQSSQDEYDPWNDPSLDFTNKIFDVKKDQPNIPSVVGLLCEFENCTLSLVSPSDSIAIIDTKGAFDLMNNVFIGSNGKVNWQVNQGKVTALLDKYAYKVTGSKFLAQQVEFSLPELIKKPVKGTLEFKLEKRPKNVESTYPRFKSYNNDAELILNIKNYKYKGGISLLASTASSASQHDPYATLEVNKGGKNYFIAQSRNFLITDSLILSDRISFVTKFDKDSISNPAVKMRFDLDQNILVLSKLDRGGFRNAMYSDTFHQVDIRCDVVYWPLNSGKMDFSIVSGKSEVSALFESYNYYNPDRVRYLSKAAGFNPLILAGNIVARKKVNKVTVQEMMDITKKEKYLVSNGMLIGNQMGFFDYDPFSNSYSLSRKGEHYFLSFMGKADFDDLVLSSLSPGAGNASIDINTKSLDIKGTQDFKLSDSLGINFKPKNQAMQIVGNKVFTFNGEISVKNFKFYGDFEVQYEAFLVKLKRIDSITFIPLDQYKKGGNNYIGGNFIYGKTGTLYLNSPDNKSGRKVLPEFPKLDIPGGVLVYFNEPGRKQKFNNEVFFKNTTLKIDSLNSMNPVFSGVFNTANIFKPINENLTVMPDSSMGIMHKAKVPYKLYGGESTLKAETEIVLNRSGIKTTGEISHLASKLKGKEINFYTEYATAKGDIGKITELSTSTGAYFPDVTISEYKMYWDPKGDSMAIASEKGFDFYKNSSQLKGSLIVRTKGLFGNGKLDRLDSDVESENFKFNKTGFLAENANFNIKSVEEAAKPVFSSQFVGVDFNITNSVVKISAQNTGFSGTQSSLLSFPFTSYNTTIDNATWAIKDKKITMAGALENSVFKSTNPNQYGLKFNGSSAIYDIAGNNLNVSGVEAINSVDAFIVPNKGFVAVQKDGTLAAFTNSKIIADTLNKYHILTNASVKINSKLSYSGNADYQFVNVSSDTFNIKLGSFEFAEIGLNGNLLSSKASNRLSTIARAKVTEKDGVYLSPKILYKGEITMLAPNRNLSLNGQVLPELKKYPMLGGNWINYSGNKSEAISINVDNTLKDGGKPLTVGMHLRNGVQSDAMYPTFLSSKKSEEDLDIFRASGVFTRDEPNKRFVIKETNPDIISNSYEFYDDKGIISMIGRFNLLGAESKIFETVGRANLRLDSMRYELSTLMKFDFPLSIPTTQKMGQNIVKSNLDVGNSDAAIMPNSEEFIEKLAQYTGAKEASDYTKKSQKEHIPLHKFSTKFLSTFVLSDVTLKWNPIANAYHSMGKIGISNIGDVDINAMTDGYVEIVKSPLTGDELNLFIEISPTNWYYFVYKGGQFGVTSSDEDLNKLLITPVTGKESKTDVNFIDINEAQKFRKRFLTIYKGYKESDFAQKPNAKDGLPGQPKTKSPTKKEDEKEGF